MTKLMSLNATDFGQRLAAGLAGPRKWSSILSLSHLHCNLTVEQRRASIPSDAVQLLRPV